MGKTRELFEDIRNTKGIFHAEMGTIKDRNGVDLTEAEDIKKRWQKYTEELYKKDLHDWDNHLGVISPGARHPGTRSQMGLKKHHHKEASPEGIPAELFQILKYDAEKVLPQYVRKFGNLSSGHRTGKGQLSFQSQRRAMPRMFKLLGNSTHLTHYQRNAQHFPSQASTVCEQWTSRCSTWI